MNEAEKNGGKCLLFHEGNLPVSSESAELLLAINPVTNTASRE